jgi:DNA-binding transcriptional ArsR family regulator
MSRTPFHPTVEQIELSRVLDCLSDPIRLAIVLSLADTTGEVQEMRCRDFHALGGKSNLTYHFDKLRDAGVVRVRLVGTSRYMQLRWDDLEARLPGLLPAILGSARGQINSAAD